MPAQPARMRARLPRRSGCRPAPCGRPRPCTGRAAGHGRAHARAALAGQDRRQHRAAAARQGRDVRGAVVDQRRPLGVGVRAAAQGQVAHLGLLVGVHRSSPINCSAPSSPRPQGSVKPVRLDPELGVEVEDARRQRPAERQEAAQLGAGVVGDEQRLRPDRERCCRDSRQLVGPQPQLAAGAQLARDHAVRLGRLAVRRTELEVAGPDLAVGQPRQRRTCIPPEARAAGLGQDPPPIHPWTRADAFAVAIAGGRRAARAARCPPRALTRDPAAAGPPDGRSLDHRVPEREPQQLPERQLGPLRLGQDGRGLEQVVLAGGSIGGQAHPLPHGQLGAAPGALGPGVAPAGGVGQPHRPQEHATRPVGRREQGDRLQFVAKLGAQFGRDHVAVAVLLQLEDRRVHPEGRFAVHPDELLAARLADRDVGDHALDPDQLGAGRAAAARGRTGWAARLRRSHRPSAGAGDRC